MAKKSEFFNGGTNLGQEGGVPANWNNTMAGILSFAAKGIAQNAYQTLQANNIFENKDYLAADEMTDSTGTNDTVNTGSTTANFGVNKYFAQATDGTEELSTSTARDGSGAVSYTVSWTGAKGYFSSFDVGNNDGSPQTVTVTVTKSGNVIATKGLSVGSGADATITFASTDYSEFLTNGDSVTIDVTGPTFNERKSAYSYTGTLFSISSQTVNTFGTGSGVPVKAKPVTFSNGVLVCDSDTLTLTGNEGAILVYVDKTLPVNTSITVDISDGTTTLSAQSINTLININSLSSGTLELTFNLGTTDSSASPELVGYGVYLSDE